MKWGLSVHPSFRPSFHLSGNFNETVSLIFSKFWHGARNSYEVVRDRAGFSGKIFFVYKSGKIGPKRAKNRAFSIWSLILAEFDLQWKFTLFLCSCRNPIFRKGFVPEIWTKIFSVNQKQPLGVFYKTAIPKNFVILKGRHLCWGLFFIKVAGLYVSSRIKKRLQYRYFLVNIGKFIRASILKN